MRRRACAAPSRSRTRCGLPSTARGRARPHYQAACRRGWEGVIAKNGDRPYVSRRTRYWLKFKCRHEQEFVIGGYTDPQGQRIGFGALLVGYYSGGKLVYAGKVGTRFDYDTLRDLGRQLAALELPAPPFAGDGLPRNRLRHPRFLGLREDKRPQEVVRES